MTLEELGQKVKAKYPQYKDMEDARVGSMVAAKHPEYAAQVTSSSGQKIYSHQDEQSKTEMAWEASKEAFTQKIPGLDQFGRFLSQDAPGYIAEKTGASHFPFVKGAGIAVAGTLGTIGEFSPRSVGDVAIQAAGGPIVKEAGEVLAPLKAMSENISRAMLSRDIGIAEPFIKNVQENSKVLKGLSEDMSAVFDHAKSLSAIMKRGEERLGAKMGKVEDSFIESALKNPEKLKTVALDDIVKELDAMSTKKGVEGASRTISKVNAIVGSDAAKINEYRDMIKSVKDEANAVDLLRIRRRLGDDIGWGNGESVMKGIGDQANGILKNLHGRINDKIAEVSPELKEASDTFSKAKLQYDILRRKVFGGTPEEAYNRVKIRIQRGVAPQALIERAAQISHESERAMKALVDKVSAQQFAPYVRKGIGGGFLGMSGATATAALGEGALMGADPHIALKVIMADLGAAALSSPRLAALGIRAMAPEIPSGIVEASARGAAQALSSGAIDQGKAQ